MASTDFPLTDNPGLTTRLRSVEPAVAARVQVVTNIDQARPVWRQLITDGAVYARYQQIGWMSRWWEHIGSLGSMELHLTVLRDGAERPIMFLPLVRKRIGPLRVGMFMGGKHANLNLPIWRPEYFENTSPPIHALVTGLRANDRKLDVLLLLNQPRGWRGLANPLLTLPHQTSSGQVHSCALREDFEALLKDRVGGSSRKKLRQKVRLLGGPEVVSSRRAQTAEDIQKVLDAFFEQKRARMQELGLRNVFDGPGVEDFITSAASEVDPDTGDSVVELYATFVGDSVAATFGGIYADKRFSGMFNSMTAGPLREHSPGDLLLTNVIRFCCERGAERFDLGVGDAAYKKVFCDETELLYDSIVPLSAIGYIAAPLLRSALALKGIAKQSDLIVKAHKILQRYTSRSVSS